mmetsp:Transcript_85791/g.165160  ORF Transcript_85791/g.165160 Transcript_85791/m.165160 type:complete len:210 (-) Transcript_85791:4-633(-)
MMMRSSTKAQKSVFSPPNTPFIITVRSLKNRSLRSRTILVMRISRDNRMIEKFRRLPESKSNPNCLPSQKLMSTVANMTIKVSNAFQRQSSPKNVSTNPDKRSLSASSKIKKHVKKTSRNSHPFHSCSTSSWMPMQSALTHMIKPDRGSNNRRHKKRFLFSAVMSVVFTIAFDAMSFIAASLTQISFTSVKTASSSVLRLSLKLSLIMM